MSPTWHAAPPSAALQIHAAAPSESRPLMLTATSLDTPAIPKYDAVASDHGDGGIPFLLLCFFSTYGQSVRLPGPIGHALLAQRALTAPRRARNTNQRAEIHQRFIKCLRPIRGQCFCDKFRHFTMHGRVQNVSGDAVQSGEYAQNIAVDRRFGFVKSERADRSHHVRTDAGQSRARR